MSDILDEMTKAELIQWIRGNVFGRRPRRSEVLFMRWETQSEKLRGDYQAELDRWAREKPDFKKCDRLAEQFNSSADGNEKLALLAKMQPFHDAMKDHMRRCGALDRRQKDVDALLKLCEAEREKERGTA